MALDLTRRGLTFALAALAAAIPEMGAAATSASTSGAPLDLVDAERRSAVRQPDKVRIPMLREQDIPAFRRASTQAPPPPLANPPVRQEFIPGRRGAPPGRIFIVDGGASSARPSTPPWLECSD